MPCLHQQSLGSFSSEDEYKSNTEPKTPGRPRHKIHQEGPGSVGEKTVVTSAGWIYTPLWSRRAKSRSYTFRKGVGSDTVGAILDDHSDFARSYFFQNTPRDMVNGSTSDKSSQSSKEGARSKKKVYSSTPQLCRRRESHPTCLAARRHSGPFLDRPSALLPLDTIDYLTLEKGNRLPCITHPPRSPRSPRASRSPRPPRSPRLSLSPTRVGPCGRRASCDWMVEVMGGAPCRQGLAEICNRVLHHVVTAISADQCSFALVRDDRAGGRTLSGVVFRSDEEGSIKQEQPHWDSFIMEYVIATGKSLNIMDVFEDARFRPEEGETTGSRPRSILSLPVYNPREELVGIAMAINKISSDGMSNGKSLYFSEEDEKILSTHMAMLGVILDNAQLCESAEQESKRSQVLLDLARLLSERHESQESLLNKMASTILPITQAQFCTVFILDNIDQETFSNIIATENLGPGGHKTSCKRRDDVNKLSLAYAVHVKNSLETLNVANISTDRNTSNPDEHCEESQGEMRTLVCTPVRNGREGKVIGVCQLVNRQSEGASRAEVFSRADERLLEDFALYCGLGLQNFEIHQKAERTRARQAVIREVLSYHISASEEEINALQESAIPSAHSLSLLEFSFSDFGLPESTTTQATVRMFLDLNLVQDFNIDYKSLCRWVLSVKRGYRKNVAYHNWHHALSTAQCMFAMLEATVHLKRNFSRLEVLALMIATLCHDLDHRGVNNSYIARSQQPLAQLYGGSSLEHHHYDLCVLILNNPGSEILSGLSQEDYRQCLQMIEQSILATDLALYMTKRDEFLQIAERGTLHWEDKSHRDLLRSMLMTASDICAITKPWDVQRKAASLIASEFFAQGDREKDEFNIKPIDVMNRENSRRFPHMQVDYINGICAPLYKALAGIFDSCNPLLEGCMDNRENWQRLADGEDEEVFETED